MNNKKAFTLVELIVVVTILSILAAIGFVSYTSYLSGVRDSNRLSALTSISDGLELYRTKSQLPYPDESIEIRASGERIGWQGEARKNVLNTLEYSQKGVDPIDDTYFVYYLSRDKKNYQLMTLLENDPNEEDEDYLYSFITPRSYAAEDDIEYDIRYPHVSGRNLGVFTGMGDHLNMPINRITSLIDIGHLDIVTTTDNYNSYINNSTIISGNGTVLSAVSTNSSCKRLYALGNNENGIYRVNPTGSQSYEVYCNMKLAGGGWTLVATRADDGANTWTYDNTFSAPNTIHSGVANIYNADIIGSVAFRKRDYKSQAYSQLIFKDMMFLDKSGVWGAYNDMNEAYNTTLLTWLPQNLACSDTEGRHHLLTSGNVSKGVGVSGEQQSRKLFMTIYDRDTGGCQTAGGDNAYGPTWGYLDGGAYSPDSPGVFGWGVTDKTSDNGRTVECGEARLGTKAIIATDTCAIQNGRDNDGEFIMWYVR